MIPGSQDASNRSSDHTLRRRRWAPNRCRRSTLWRNEPMTRFAVWLVLAMLLPVAPGWIHGPGPRSAKATVSETREQRHDEAVQAFEEQRDRAQLEAAVARWNQGDISGCESRLRAILARRPNDVEAHARLAELAWSCENHVEAENEYRAALQLAPERADLEHALGLMLQATGRATEALPHFA